MNKTNVSHEFLEEIAAASGVYRLLARLLLKEVDIETVVQLSQEPIRHLFVEAGGSVPDSQAATSDSVVIDQLAIDYCQIFLGPKNHLPPYQSVWQAGQFQSDTIDSMRQFIEIANYSPPNFASDIMLDHIGIQFDAMGHILQQFGTANLEEHADLQLSHDEATNSVAFDSAATDVLPTNVTAMNIKTSATTAGHVEMSEFAKAFLDSHLRWAMPMLRAASEKAETQFLRSAITLAHDFLSSEMQFWNAVHLA